MKAIFHPEAHVEMIESARFYEGKGEGLGLDFLTAVEAATRRIEQFPESVPISEAHIRKRLVTGFPFTILYEFQSDSNLHRSRHASTSQTGLLAKTDRVWRRGVVLNNVTGRSVICNTR